jgi:PAS domain S-box-containing protein
MQPHFDPTASDAAFRDVADLLPTGLALFEDDDNCVFVNRCAADLVARPAESLLGSGWLQVVHPDDAEEFDKAWTEARTARAPFAHGLRVRTDDGDRHLLARSTPMPRGRWLVTLDDRTSEVEATATLREREAEFRLLAENSTDMITRFTPDGRLLYVSPASRQLLGYGWPTTRRPARSSRSRAPCGRSKSACVPSASSA